MPYTRQTQITHHKCGYSNHLVTNCTVRKIRTGQYDSVLGHAVVG